MCDFSQQEEKREFYSLTTFMEAVFLHNFGQQTLLSPPSLIPHLIAMDGFL